MINNFAKNKENTTPIMCTSNEATYLSTHKSHVYIQSLASCMERHNQAKLKDDAPKSQTPIILPKIVGNGGLAQ